MYFYETPGQRRIEIANECILLAIVYHFALLADPSLELDKRKMVGYSTIIMVLSLLAFNTTIIIVVSVKTVMRKCYLRKLEKK